jgi:hypothetical protein
MPAKTANIERKLKGLGLSDDVIHAAWPTWWSEEAEFSSSALNELRFSLSRKLGISPDSLFDEGNATFLWDGPAKFKGLDAETDSEKAALVSYGSSVGRLLAQAANPSQYQIARPSAQELRKLILESGAPFVRLVDVLGLCWALGIAVIQLRVFPLTSKRMTAMAIQHKGRFVILLGRDSNYPAIIAYHIAHELGHIMEGHLTEESALVDVKMPDEVQGEDAEEQAADKFGMMLLTGIDDLKITRSRPPRNPRELANAVANASSEARIEPGTLALCYAYQTKNWALAIASLRHIYPTSSPVWLEVNKIAQSQLNFDTLTEDNQNFIFSVMGMKPNGEGTTRQ